MSIAALIRAMTAAGAPPEAIALAVDAIEAKDAELRRKKDIERDRKRRQRVGQSRDSHGTVTVLSADPSPTPPSSIPSLNSEGKQTLNAPAREARARRLPDDWTPSEADLAVAEELGFGADVVAAEVVRMRDWSRSAKDGARKDWSAFFRNWMRRRMETGPPGRPAQVGPLFPGDRNDRHGNSPQRSRDGARSPTGHAAYLALLDPRPADDGGFGRGPVVDHWPPDRH